MALVKCSECSEKISKKAEVCPKCGHPNKGGKSSVGGVVGAIIVFFVLVSIFSGDGEYTSFTMSGIEQQVAQDAVDQYNIAKRQGDAIQICVQAGLVSAAYLQAEDEGNYNLWKSTERSDCNRAGISYN